MDNLVSVLLPTFNRAHTLAKAIDSVVAQTLACWELIIIDNCSLDGTDKLLQTYHDSRIRKFSIQNGGNISLSLNLGIEKSAGNLIAFLNSDDWWLPDKLEQQIGLFEDKEVGVVYGNYFYFNAEENGQAKVRHHRKLPDGFILDQLLGNYFISIKTVIIRRSAVQNMKTVFDERYHMIGDYDLMLRLARDWKYSCVQNPVSTYSWHGGNETILRNDKFVFEQYAWLKENSSDDTISKLNGFGKRATFILCAVGIKYARRGERRRAWQYFRRLPIGVSKLKLLAAIILPGFSSKFSRT